MTIKVQVAGAWVTVSTGEFRVRNPTVSTDWIYAAKVQVCMNDGPGGANRWIDSGYVGVPNAPTSFHNIAWDYDSMTVNWLAPVDNGIPVSGYRVTVVQNSPAGATRTFDSTTAMQQTFSVAEDTKYTVTVKAKGDTGVYGASTAEIRPWIGHPKISTFANVTKWRDWQSDTKLFSKGPPDTGIYRNEIEGIYIYPGYKAEQLHVNLSGKYPWVPEDGYIINSTDRKGEWIVASAHISNIAVQLGPVWSGTFTLGPQTTAGAYGIRLLGTGWDTAGGTKGLTGSMYAIGQESYIDRVETVTRTEQKNALW